MDQREVGYEKGNSASNAGSSYQIKLLTIFLLRGVLQGNKFNLATEMRQEDVGKFDDIIFSWIGQNLSKQSILLQSKHSLSKVKKISLKTLLSSKDNDYSLVTYFYSYLDKIKFNVKLGDVERLVVFTNMDVDDTVNNHKEQVALLDFILKYSKEDVSGYFYKFPSKFMEQLRDKVVIYHCQVVAKTLSDNLLRRRNIPLLQNNNILVKIESALLCYCFEFNSTDNGHRIIKLKREFISDEVNGNEICKTFKECLIEALKIKSKLFWEQMTNVGYLKDDHLFDLNDLNLYLNHFVIQVEGDINGNYECLSNEMISMEDVRKFSEMFILAVDQPNVDELDHCIYDLLTQLPLFQSFNASSAARHLLSQVDKWFNDKTGVFITEKTSNDILMNTYLEVTSLLCIGKKNSLNISFSLNRLGQFSNEILSQLENQTVIHIHSKCNSKFTLSKLHQVLLNKGNYFYLELSLVIDKLLEGINLIDAIRNIDSLTGVVFCCTNSHLHQYFSLIQSMNKLIEHCKIIFITPDDGDDTNSILNDAFNPMDVKHVHCDISITELSADSLNLIFSRKNIEFQGMLCSLLDLLRQEDIVKFMDMNALSDITDENTIVIGDTSNSLSDLPAAYSQCFQRISLDRLLSLVSRDKYIFVISICEKSIITKSKLLDLCQNEPKCDDFNNKIHTFILQNVIIFDHNKSDHLWNQEQFRAVCKKFLNKVIFWIEVKNNDIVLQQVFNPYFYLKRRLNYVESVEIKPDKILKALRDGYTRFVISNTTKYDVLQHLIECEEKELDKWLDGKNIIISQESDAKESFNKSCKMSGDVHWIELKDGQILWVKSNGSLDFIRKCKLNILSYEEEHFTSMTNTMVIISDVAGMGKSTILTSITHRMMVNETKRWIIKINFKETCVQNGLQLMAKKQITVETIRKFISNINYLNANNSIAKVLLAHYLVSKDGPNNKLVLVLDGLDEIPPTIQLVAKELVSFLKQHSTCTIFLATRQHCAPSLEDHFSVFAMNLQEISLDDQCSFLINCWHNQLTLISDEFCLNELRNTASKYLEKMRSLLKENLKFLGIPLHLRLISEVSLPCVINKFENFLMDKMDLKMLFELFIKTKYDIYFNKKSSTGSLFSSHNTIAYNFFEETHAKFAFLYLFPEYLHTLKLKIEEYSSDFMLIGLLHSKSNNSDWYFFHRTFCEYYCASFLMDCLNDKENNETLYRVALEVFKNKLCLPPSTDPFRMLKIFLDHRLVNDFPLHKSIFRNDSICVSLIKKTDITQKDILGRTSLHIAAQYGDSEIVTVLLNCGSNGTDVDVLGRIPLHCASQSGHIKNVKSLIAPYIDINVHRNIFMKSLDDQIRPETVFDVGVFEQSTLCKVINMKAECGKTCLYYSVQCEEWNLCHLLIAHGANLSSLNESQEISLLTNLVSISSLTSNSSQEMFFPAIALLGVRNSNVMLQFDQTYCMPKLIHNLIYFGYSRVLKRLLSSYSSVKLTKILNVDYNFSYPLSGFCNISKFLSDNEHLEVLQYLLENGSSSLPNIKNDANKHLEYCLQSAARWGHLETFKYIINLAQKEYQFKQSPTLFQRLSNIFSSNNVCIQNINMFVVLNHAIIMNQRNIVEFIWKCYRHLVTDKTNGNTPLLSAVYHGHLLNLAEFFCQRGADVNCSNHKKVTPLHLAAEQKNLSFIKYLVSKGADVNALDSDSKTVLDYALTSLEYKNESHFWEEFSSIEYLVLDCSAKTFRDFISSDVKERKEIVKATHSTVNIPLDGTTLLHKAVEMGNEILIRHLLSLGAKVNAENSNGRTPLECLQYPSHISHILLEYGARFNAQTKHHLSTTYYYHPTMIHGVPKIWDLFTTDTLAVDINSYILDDGKLSVYSKPNPMTYIRNAVNCYGSLVHRAALADDLEALSILLEYDDFYSTEGYLQSKVSLNLSLQNDDGDSPMHIAARCGNVDILKVLIKNGAKYNNADFVGRTPAQCCDGQTENGLQIIKILKFINEFLENVSQNSLARVEKMLIDCECVNVRDEFGRTPLHWAVHRGHFKMTALLLENGANKELTDDLKQTPLHYASKLERQELVYLLLSHGCTFNCKDQNGEKPSDLWVKDGNVLREIEQVFYFVLNDDKENLLNGIMTVEKDTDLTSALVNTCDVEGNTLLHFAAYKGNLDIVQFAFTHGAMYNKTNRMLKSPINPYKYDLSCYKLFSYVDQLFDNHHCSNYMNIKYFTNVRNRNGDTLLHCTDDLYLAKLLIEHSKRNIDCKDAEGKTPLMRAIMRNNLILVKVMLEGGADVKMKANNGDTCLHVAVRVGNLSMIQYLVEIEGIKNVTTENRLGYTPIHIALSLDNEEILAFLLNTLN